MAAPQITTLDNGFKVVTQHMPSKQVYTNLAIGVGSRDEAPEESGASHFLEHMLADDTVCRTTKEREKYVKGMRGTWNASTTEEKTDYHYRVANEFLEKAVTLLADGLLRSTLDPEKIRKEKNAVQEELLDQVGDAEYENYMQVMRLAFPKTGLANEIGGTQETVETMDRDSLLAFMAKHYSPDKMTLTVVGEVEHDQIVAMAKEHFEGLKSFATPPRASADYRGGYQVTESKEVQQINFTLAFEGISNRDAHARAVDSVMQSILNEELMDKLRNEAGLVYSVGASSERYSDTGLLSIDAGFRSVNARKFMEVLTTTLKDFAQRITAEDVQDAKNEILGGYERASENLEAVAERIVTSTSSLGAPVTFDDNIDSLKDVTLEEVKQRAAAIFAQIPTVSAYGKGASKLPSYAEITRSLGVERQVDEQGLVVDEAPSPDRSLAEATITATPGKIKGLEKA